jgi:spore germination cell wall hydrolase CwlJ-like protein
MMNMRVRGRRVGAIWALVAAGAAVALSATRLAPGLNPGRNFEAPGFAEVPAGNLLRPIAPEEALRENADRSFSKRSDSPAAPFRFAGDQVTEDRALECLTQAVYYEAAGDSRDDERAVAQVVLNRVRHPGFPSTICGVIYEGAPSPGCQFTFTCDGSLARIPVPAIWRQAQQIAIEELRGKVFAPVGHATHYHADYVLPYWADSLDKSVEIGRQIFYRLKGSPGEAGAFAQRYANREPPPPDSIGSPVRDQSAQQANDEDKGSDEAALATASPPIAPAHLPLVAADMTHGVLIGDSTVARTERPPVRTPSGNAEKCEPKQSQAQLRPLAPDSNRGPIDQQCSS